MKRLLIPTIAIAVCAVAITYAAVATNQLRRENAALLHQAHEEAESRLAATRAETARLQTENQALRSELGNTRRWVGELARTFSHGSLLHYYPQPWWVQWLLAPFGSFRA